jgi:hypothetical protein
MGRVSATILKTDRQESIIFWWLRQMTFRLDSPARVSRRCLEQRFLPSKFNSSKCQRVSRHSCRSWQRCQARTLVDFDWGRFWPNLVGVCMEPSMTRFELFFDIYESQLQNWCRIEMEFHLVAQNKIKFLPGNQKSQLLWSQIVVG